MESAKEIRRLARRATSLPKLSPREEGWELPETKLVRGLDSSDTLGSELIE